MRNINLAPKRRHSPALLLLLTITAFLIAPATHSLAARHSYPGSPAADGRLVMKYSVTLGINIALNVKIDGRDAGAFTRGHLFHVALAPGSHLLSVRPNGRRFDEWTGRLNVRPGQTSSFLIKYSGNQVQLVPSMPFHRFAH